MTTQDTPVSPFLEQQKRVMAQKEQLERDLEQRQRYTLTPAAAEKPHDPKAKYEIVTFDATNNKTTHRTITPLPQPERIRPAQPLSKNDLIEMLDALRDDLATEQEKFDRKDELDAAAANKRGQLIAKVNELTAQLNAAKSELDDLNRAGSTRDGFIAFAKRAEQRITAIATGTYNFLLEKISQERHDSDYKSLPPLLSEDVRFRVDKLGTRFLTQPSFASLHRTPTEQITNARIEATLEKVYTATEKLEKALQK